MILDLINNIWTQGFSREIEESPLEAYNISYLDSNLCILSLICLQTPPPQLALVLSLWLKQINLILFHMTFN